MTLGIRADSASAAADAAEAFDLDPVKIKGRWDKAGGIGLGVPPTCKPG